MQKLRIIEAERISTGKRIYQLVKQTGKTQETFLEDLEIWKDDHSDYKKINLPQPRDFSRWAKDDGVQMRSKRIQMFADYFGVDFDYLNCTQIETHRSLDRLADDWEGLDQVIDLAELLKEVQQYQNHEKIISLLKQLGYKIDFIPTSSEMDSTTHQFLDNRTIYTVEVVIDSGTDWVVSLTYPDGTEQEITESEFNGLLSDFKKYIDFSMERIKA